MKVMMGESLSNVKFKGDFLLCDGYILYICVEYNINIGNLIFFLGRYYSVIFVIFIYFGDLYRLIFLFNLIGSFMLCFMMMYK